MNTNNSLDKINIVSSKKSRFLKAGAAGNNNDIRSIVSRYDDVMVKWINASDENKQKFMKDPVGCFRKVAAPDEAEIDALRNAAPMTDDTLEESGKMADDVPAAGNILKAATNNMPVSTHGWDIVSAIKIDKLNKILSLAYDSGILPKSFQTDFELKVFGVKIKISMEATLDAMSVCSGTGENIDIKIPIKALSVNNANQTITCDIDLIITVNLECVETTRSDNSTLYTYYFKLGDDSVKNAVAENVPDEIIAMFGNKEIFEGMVKHAILEAANGAKVKICEINSEDIKSQYKFLIPKSAKYCFKQSNNIEDSILAILLQTTSAEQGVRTVDDNVLPKDCDGSLILENRLFFENILKNPIAASLNTTADNLELRRLTDVLGNPYELYNKDSFKYKKVEDYTPKITKFTISEYQNKLYLHLDAVVTPTEGINLKYYANGKYSMIIKEKDGVQTLVLDDNDGKDFESDHSLDIEWWVWTCAALAGLLAIWIAGPLVAAILSAISIGIAAAVGAIISAIAPSGLEASIFTSAVDTVKWNYANIVSFKEVGLFGDVQLGVTIPILDK